MIVLLLLALLVSAKVHKPLAPLLSSESAIALNDKYIVVLKDQIATQHTLASHKAWLAQVLAEDKGSSVGHEYQMPGFKGYYGHFSADTLEKIRGSDMVEFVERDQLVSIHRTLSLSQRARALLSQLDFSLGDDGIIHILKEDGIDLGKKTKTVTQTDAPWGLARTCRRDNDDLDTFVYPKSAGEGVNVYVVDTGINIKHADFGGRAVWGKTIPLFDQDIDGNGHGTHCAGTIASETFGLAKKATVIAVKVLRTSGFGTNSDVLKGIEYVLNQHMSKGGKTVANMSLGGGRSLALERAIDQAVASGVHFAVAAGNDSKDACNYSPAAAEGPITVGASNRLDELTYFSNHGSCVDIVAPGMDIPSTWIGGDDATNTISGTSMASPHVAGVMALYLGIDDYAPKDLKKKLVKDATKGKLLKLPVDTPDALLNINALLGKE